MYWRWLAAKLWRTNCFVFVPFIVRCGRACESCKGSALEEEKKKEEEEDLKEEMNEKKEEDMKEEEYVIVGGVVKNEAKASIPGRIQTFVFSWFCNFKVWMNKNNLSNGSENISTWQTRPNLEPSQLHMVPK